MLSTFVLLIAGCGHDTMTCTEVHRMEVEAATLAECERVLEVEMAASRVEFPVLEGVCLPEGLLA